MANKLKIYACSGIGSAQAEQPVKYWTDGTSTISNTQAVNTLLAEINLRYIAVSRLSGMTPEEKIELLNEIDVLSVCLEAAKRFSGKTEELVHAGNVIGCMVRDKAFDCKSLNNNDREDHLDELIEKANQGFSDQTPCEAPSKFVKWWTETVIDRDKVGLSKEQQASIKKATKSIKGIGASDDWMKDAELAEYLTRGSEYFLYTYFTDEQLKKLPSVFRVKKQKQIRTYNYCKALFVDVYGDEAQMKQIIYAGIIDYFQATPEDVCAQIIKEGKLKGVGDGGASAVALGAAEIVAIITAVLGLVGTIIAAVCSAVAQTNVAKYGALDKEIVSSSVPNPEDFDGLELSGLGGESSSKWLLLAGVGIALAYLIKK